MTDRATTSSTPARSTRRRAICCTTSSGGTSSPGRPSLEHWQRYATVDLTRSTALEVGAGQSGGLSLWLALQGCDVVCSTLGDVSPARARAAPALRRRASRALREPRRARRSHEREAFDVDRLQVRPRRHRRQRSAGAAAGARSRGCTRRSSRAATCCSRRTSRPRASMPRSARASARARTAGAIRPCAKCRRCCGRSRRCTAGPPASWARGARAICSAARAAPWTRSSAAGWCPCPGNT